MVFSPGINTLKRDVFLTVSSCVRVWCGSNRRRGSLSQTVCVARDSGYVRVVLALLSSSSSTTSSCVIHGVVQIVVEAPSLTVCVARVIRDT